MQLKNGVETKDPRLDRVPQFDAQSRKFPVGNVLDILKDKKVAKAPKKALYKVKRILDQGQEGACVGYGWTYELEASPCIAYIENVNRFARNRIYKEAQKLDEWPGESYSGTSVLAGAKVVQSLGAIKEYRWCFSLQDLIMTLGYLGPVVLGLNWYDGMTETNNNGYIQPSGEMVGGHCICAVGVTPSEKSITLVNSWGSDWGKKGFCKLTYGDMDRLLHEQGEACVPLLRQQYRCA